MAQRMLQSIGRSVLKKTMERIVNAHLKGYLDTNDLLAPQQAGFRQFRSTENQTTYRSHVVQEALQEQMVVLTAWIDRPTTSVRQSLDGWAESKAYEEWSWRSPTKMDRLRWYSRKARVRPGLQHKVPTETRRPTGRRTVHDTLLGFHQ